MKTMEVGGYRYRGKNHRPLSLDFSKGRIFLKRSGRKFSGTVAATWIFDFLLCFLIKY
jgi:hypothetical protein